MTAVEEFYRFVVTIIPDWLMIIVTGAAVVALIVRYRQRENKSIFSILVPLLAFFFFYVWSTYFSPDSLARLAIGRIVSFCLIAGIAGWAFLKR